MKKFIFKLFLFFIICFIFDIGVGYTSKYLQKMSKGGLTYKDEFIKNKMNADIVIMGSSRASHHYVSNLLADSLRCTVYNAGMDGKGIIMNYGVLLEITQRYSPAIIIYELTPEFDWQIGDNEKYLSHLRHAYHNVIGIDSIFWNVNHTERIKMLSNSYRCNSLVPHLIYDNIVSPKDSLNGYVPLWGVYNLYNKEIDSNQNFKFDNNLDPIKIEYLQRFINRCKEKGIILYFAISPVFGGQNDIFTFGLKTAKKNNLNVIDFHDMSTSFNDNTLYQDNWHLNNNGATIYTEEVIKYLK